VHRIQLFPTQHTWDINEPNPGWKAVFSSRVQLRVFVSC